MSETTKTIFATLTYNPNVISSVDAWNETPFYCYHFIHDFKEKFGKVEYIQVIEKHSNTYPHIHYLLLTESTFTGRSGKDKRDRPRFYFDEYRQLQNLWSESADKKQGHDDYISPYNQAPGFIINYILKYSKTSLNAYLCDVLFGNALENPAVQSRMSLNPYTHPVIWSRNFIATFKIQHKIPVSYGYQ